MRDEGVEGSRCDLNPHTAIGDKINATCGITKALDPFPAANALRHQALEKEQPRFLR